MKTTIVLMSGLLMFLSGKCAGNENNGKAAEGTMETAIVPRSDADILTYYAWTDGSVMYRHQPSETSADSKSVRYSFIGATENEGGYRLCIDSGPDGHLTSVDPGDEGYYELSGCDVSFNGARDALIFRDKSSGKIRNALVSILPETGADGDVTFRKYLEKDLVTYFLEGKYETPDGKTVEFDPETFKAAGTLFGDASFKVAPASGMPATVIVIDDEYYYVEKVFGGLNLFPMKYEDPEDCLEGQRDGATIALRRVDDDYWPDLSSQVLTVSELLYYAGHIPYGPYSYDEIEDRIRQRKNMLATLRNSIFARHGYIFKKEEWRRVFGGMSWYKPQYESIDSILSETERINIQLLSTLESTIN